MWIERGCLGRRTRFWGDAATAKRRLGKTGRMSTQPTWCRVSRHRHTDRYARWFEGLGWGAVRGDAGHRWTGVRWSKARDVGEIDDLLALWQRID